MTTRNTPAPTFESVWESLQETDRIIKENAEEQKRWSIEQRKRSAELDRKFAETDRIVKEVSQQIKEVNKTLGAWATNHGEFAEEYFFNSFERGQTNFFGEQFDEIEKNMKGYVKPYRDEYDIVLMNGKAVGIVEVKFKAHTKDIPKVVRKAETFRANFPDYKNCKIYLGLASLSFYPELEEECLANGLAIIKQMGDTVVINDSTLRAY